MELKSQGEPLKASFPHFYECIDQQRLNSKAFRVLMNKLLKREENHAFDANSEKRGESYCEAQKKYLNRFVGMYTLLSWSSPNEEIGNMTKDYRICDIFGGDGLLAKVLQLIQQDHNKYNVLTSDISQYMVNAAYNNGYPALWQPAQFSVLKDKCMNATIAAYGTHHVRSEERQVLYDEMYRVLVNEGIALVHDFENNSQGAQFFNDVVHPFSITGHDCQHFRYEEVMSGLKLAGFKTIDYRLMWDPIIVEISSTSSPTNSLGEHLCQMYGLDPSTPLFKEYLRNKNKFHITQEHVWEAAYDKACMIFQYDCEQLNKIAKVPIEVGVKPVASVQTKYMMNRWYQGSYVIMPRIAFVVRAEKSA